MQNNIIKCKLPFNRVLVLTLLLTFLISLALPKMAMALPDGTEKIDTIAGSATEGYSGDGGQATDASFNDIYDFVFDSNGNMYLIDTNNNVIRKVDTSGVVTTIAGDGTPGYTGDGGPATSAQLNKPGAITIDNSDNLYISDTYNHVIRKIDKSGIITTIVGNGTMGSPPYGTFSGDGGQATDAGLNLPYGISFDHQGNLLIADTSNCRIRKVDMATGIISTITGNGASIYVGEGGLASDASIPDCPDVIADSAGNIFIATNYGNRVLKIDAATGIITTYAGNGVAASTLGAATESSINRPWGLAFDANENLYIVERDGFVITKLDKATGILSRVAGTGTGGYAGDGGSPLDAQLNYPTNIHIDDYGIIYVADKTNNRIREIATYYTATYTAGANGTLTGETSQTIKENTDTTEVVAVPDSGYGFVQWSDGVTSANRVDTNVTGNIDVTAQFDLEFTITLEEQGGDAVDDITQLNNTTIDTAPSVTRTGYSFNGWYQEDTYDTAVVFPHTITGNATWYAKWTEPAPTPAPTPSGTQYGTISAVIKDSNGNPVASITVELHSKVVTGVTDANGRVTFSNVPLVDHTLIIKDTDGREVGRVDLDMVEGTSNKSTVSGNEVDVTFTNSAVSVEVEVMVNSDNTVAVEDVTIVQNPDTGDGSTSWVWALAVFIVIMLICVWLLRKYHFA